MFFVLFVLCHFCFFLKLHVFVSISPLSKVFHLANLTTVLSTMVLLGGWLLSILAQGLEPLIGTFWGSISILTGLAFFVNSLAICTDWGNRTIIFSSTFRLAAIFTGALGNPQSEGILSLTGGTDILPVSPFVGTEANIFVILLAGLHGTMIFLMVSGGLLNIAAVLLL